MKTMFSALLLAAACSFAIAAPQGLGGPESKEEVLRQLRGRVPSSVIAETVLRNGISFEPTGEVLREFRKAGAGDTVIRAIQESWRWESKRPLSDRDILELLAEHMPPQGAIRLIRQRGIAFEPAEQCIQVLRSSGAKDDLISAVLVASRRPFSRDFLLQLLTTAYDVGQIGVGVADRGIDFDPSAENIATLREAGAPESLLQAVREAKQFKEARVICPPQMQSVPVLSNPNNPNTVLTGLDCLDRVVVEEKDSGRSGVDKVFFSGGGEGFVQDGYLKDSIPKGYSTPPICTYHVYFPYSSQPRLVRIQGKIKLWIDIDAQGNVTDAGELSKPLGGGLDRNAIETVKRWKYKPATRDGLPVPTRTTVEFTFP